MKIIAPNKNYTGVSAGVPFTKGVGDCSDADIIKWFERQGYAIQESLDSEENTKIEELQKELEEAKSNFIEFNTAHETLVIEYQNLKAENDKLKKELEKLKKAGA